MDDMQPLRMEGDPDEQGQTEHNPVNEGLTAEREPSEATTSDREPFEPPYPEREPLEPALVQTPPVDGWFDPTLLWIMVVGGLLVGSIVSFSQLNFGVNDGSRWNTVFYLVEHGTYEYLPDHDASEMIMRYRARVGPHPDRPWHIPPFYTIDMVGQQAEDGTWHYYSSKPPFLPTVLAGVVLLIQKLSFGTLEFNTNPFFFIRTTLILTQVIPLLIGLWLIRSHLPRLPNTPFVTHFSIATVMIGTYLTGWSVTLNNHIPAAWAVMFALHAAIRIVYDGRREWYWFTIAGFFAAFAACCDLPAGLLAVSLFVILLYKDRLLTLAAGLPAALVPTFVALLVNYLAIGSLLPAYADIHREGGLYDYPGSYWTEPRGIDALQEPKSVYLFNMMLGFRGFFSLNPVLLLCGVGIVSQLVRREALRRELALFTLVLTAAVVAVYVVTTNNYGGGSKGIRWLFWLIPFWLLFISDGVTLLARYKCARAVCYVLLAVSLVSIGDALRSPWGHPWIEQFYRAVGWITY